MKATLARTSLFKDESSRSLADIVVEIYDSAQLYKDKEVPAAVGSGAIEAGVASLTRYVGDIPAVDIFYQPFLFDTEDKVRKAVARDRLSAVRSMRPSGNRLDRPVVAGLWQRHHTVQGWPHQQPG